jgi:hypothetical protein
VNTGTIYADVDLTTWETGYVRVQTERSKPFLVRVRNLEAIRTEPKSTTMKGNDNG